MSTNLSNQNLPNFSVKSDQTLEATHAASFSSIYDSNSRNSDSPSVLNNFNLALQLEDDSSCLNDNSSKSDLALDEEEEEENVNQQVRPSTSNQSEFKLLEKEFASDDDDDEDLKEKKNAAANKKDFEVENIKTEISNNSHLIAAAATTVADSDSNTFHDVVDNEEDLNEVSIEQNDEWRSKSKHIFILSEAGKPIFSLHGNEVDLITFMGLLQALVSIIECDNGNKLNFVIAGDHKIVFIHKTHLILICVSSEPDICIEQLELELSYIYNQIISVCTLSLINKIFAKHHNYDLRNKLTGTEKLLTNISKRFKNDFGMLLNCVNSYPLQNETREQISRIIAQHINPIRYVIFGLLFFDNRLVSLIRPKTKNIHPIDVHLLVNVITGLDTPKSSEFTWYPICLPNFDSNGIMYAYIAHLDETCKTCLILLTGLCDQEQSSELNECRKRIQQKMQTQSISQLMSSKNKDVSLRLDQIGVSELKHFLFKDNKVFQYFVSDYASPYANNPEQKQRIFDMYQKLYHRLHNPTNTLKIIYMQQKYETILGWMTSNFEIYATFSPLVTKDITIRAINKLLEFTQKNKSKIFLNAMPTIQR
jgi:hypothetical protein